MKKILLTVFAMLAVANGFAQTLSFGRIDGHATDNPVDVPMDANGKISVSMPYTYSEFEGMVIESFQMTPAYFYVINNSDKSVTVTPQSTTMLNEFAQNHLSVSFCYNGNCWMAPFPSFTVPANGDYRGEKVGEAQLSKDSEMDASISYRKYQNKFEEGVGEVKCDFQVEGESDVYSFYLDVTCSKTSDGLSVVSAVSGLKVYQDASGNLVADYGFGNAKDRILSIVGLSGEVLYRCKITNGSGNMTLPVELKKGMYLYSVTEAGKVVAAHKFVVR